MKHLLPDVVQQFQMYDQIVKTNTAVTILVDVCGSSIMSFIDKAKTIHDNREYMSVNRVFIILYNWLDREKTWKEKIVNFFTGSDSFIINELNKKIKDYITYPFDVAWNISKEMFDMLNSDYLYNGAFTDVVNYNANYGYTLQEAIKLVGEQCPTINTKYLRMLCLLYRKVDPSIYYYGEKHFIDFICAKAKETNKQYRIYQDRCGNLYAYTKAKPENDFKLRITIKPKEKINE